MNLFCDDTATDTADGRLGTGTAGWPSPVIFDDLPTGWLSSLARDFTSNYDISEIGAVTLLLSAVGAVSGGGAWLRGSDGLAVSAPLNTLFVGAGGSFRSAGDNAWSAGRARLGSAPDVVADIDTTRSEIIGLRARLADVTERNRAMDALDKQFADAEQKRLVRKHLYEEETQATQDLERIGRSAAQRILIEGGSLAQLMTPSKLAHDRAIHHLCSAGTVVARLIAAPTRLLADLTDLTAHVWIERFASASSAANLGELLSHSFILSEGQAARLLENSRIRASGLIDQFLMIDLRSVASAVQHRQAESGDAWAGFARVTDELVKDRETLNRKVYSLCSEAEEKMGTYVRDRNAEARELGPARPEIFDRIRALVSKFALGLHLCSEYRREESVGAETVMAACALADRALSSHLGLHRDFAMREQTAVMRDPEGVEIIVERLRIRGPLSRREIARSFHAQKSTSWEPVLAQALESGRVARLPDGRFDLSEKNE